MTTYSRKAVHRTWELQALTDIWTGSVQGFKYSRRRNRYDEKVDNTRAVRTGLLGSIRWWFEVLVRGLDGPACDPSDKRDNNLGRCPDKRRKPHDPGHHCVACELFGCTDWARKFRLDVLNEQGHAKRDAIKKSDTSQLRFTPLRPIAPEEWALLDLTLLLIARYGALGGRIVYKPSDEDARENMSNHHDYGLINIQGRADLSDLSISRSAIKQYVSDKKWRAVEHGEFAWASLSNMWFGGNIYLARQDSSRSTFNAVICRPEPKKESHKRDSWIAGRRASQGNDPESKKVFSFKNPEEARRTFGFIKPESSMPERLGDLLEDNKASNSLPAGLANTKVTPGKEIRESLLADLDKEQQS